MHQRFNRPQVRLFLSVFFYILITVWVPGSPVQAANPPADTLRLTLDQAVQIALSENFGLRTTRLAIENAEWQVREARGSVYPQVSGISNYQRNVVTANPFAGTEAGGLFETFGALEWVIYNEGVRQGDFPDAEAVSFVEFMERRLEGLEQAGLTPPDTEDPFGVANQFITSLNITQTLFNGSAFAAIKGAQTLKDLNQYGFERQSQITIDEVRSAFYGALLSRQQAGVLGSSVDRIRETLNETTRLVDQGVVSRQHLLGVEVELVNLETELIEAENRADLAEKSMNLLLGLPVQQPVVLVGELEMIDLPDMNMTTDQAFNVALEQRPDIRQAEAAIEIREINREITRSQYYPVINAFADLSYLGTVPDTRTRPVADPSDPFTFTPQTRGFFHGTYWNPNLSVGIQLRWNIFSGGQNRARDQQGYVAARQAQLDYEFLLNAVRLEIDQSLNRLQAAEKRVQSQQRNTEQARQNYDFAASRLREGVGSSLEERQASMLLDQSRLAHLAAVHDYLNALSNFELAIGKSVAEF